ncbi:hypothetical protein PCANC_20720 [Puccinia coronata f. sp. avenae]|uniref:Vacuolar import/degradation Vid27 C-terminal domain-containing protein n=1 Tax=Puccinia coronata f. sp. avenae TaxID=200324 RepID=A0A2N5S5T9_9BASI|nr:hypothetical protein PCASD_23713 [Puccinia coronata f. sp. avenae]PLW10374.1 hypothetical protein PCANC_20720 [Puccinia coronata f. sp. avenae]
MFGLVRRIFGAAPAEESLSGTALELISLPAGRLNLIRHKHSTKVQKECIYLEAELAVRRTSMPFHYQLVIKRLGEDADESFDNEEAIEDDYEKAFFLAEDIELRMYETVDDSDDAEQPTLALSWLDLSSPDASERFEFVISSRHEDCRQSEIDRVVDVAIQCIWEGENKNDSSEAPDEELLAIKQRLSMPPSQPDIPYRATPSRVFRPPSTIPSDDSDLEESEDITLNFSQTSHASRAPSHSDTTIAGAERSFETHSDVAVTTMQLEYEDDDEDSDSSADEIVNQLRGTSLNDHPKQPSTSLPVPPLATSSRANGHPPVSPPHSKPETSLATQQPSPAKKVPAPTTIQTPAKVQAPGVVQKPAQIQSPITVQTPAKVQAPAKAQTPAKVQVPAKVQTSTTVQTPAKVQTSTTVQTPAKVQTPAMLQTPAKVQTPPPSTQRVPYPSIVPTKSATLPSGSVESVTDRNQERNPSSPTGPSADTQANSSSVNDRLQGFQADADCELFNHAEVTDFEDDLSDPLTVPAWESVCDIYLFMPATTTFEKHESEVTAALWVSAPVNPQPDICWLTVTPKPTARQESHAIISSPIGEKERLHNLTFASGAIFFEYKYSIPDSEEFEVKTWAIRFRRDESLDQYTAAQEAFARAMYDRDNGLGSYDAQDLDTKKWSRLAYGVSVEGCRDVENDAQSDDSEESEKSEEDEEEEVFASSDDEDDNAQLRQFRSNQSGSKNSCSVIGAQHSAVTRDNMMGIFMNESTHDKKLKHIGTIPELKTSDGRDIHPEKMIMYNGGNNVLLKDRYLPDSVFNCSLEVGKIVEEYNPKEHKEIVDLFPLNKTSEMESQKQFLLATETSLNQIDPRVSGSKKALSWKGARFTCGTTTANGEIATGSTTGEVRLYKNMDLKIAKTRLPKGRDPNRDVDVTNSGRYLVAACDTYLILYDNMTKSGQLGFQKPFPMHEKPNGIRIQLTREHQAHIASEKIPFCFKGAKFNRGTGDIEKSIITSIGPYIITFDLKSILSGKTLYTLKRYQENVVSDNFRWGNDKDIFVTLESDVIMEKRTRLARPTRESIIGLADVNPNELATRNIRTGRTTKGIVEEWEG